MRQRKWSSRAPFLAIVLVVTASCGGLPAPGRNVPPYGALYTLSSTAHNATPQNRGTKNGTSCAYSVLGLIAFGNSSIEQARRNGRITKIISVDANALSILGGLYTRMCYTVRGR